MYFLLERSTHIEDIPFIPNSSIFQYFLGYQIISLSLFAISSLNYKKNMQWLIGLCTTGYGLFTDPKSEWPQWQKPQKNWIFCKKNGRELTKSFHQNYSQLLLEYCKNNIVYFSQKCSFDTKFSQFWWFTHLRRENLSLRFTHIFRNFFLT